jgi:TDG/mug DNA glycosylase family protein
METLPDYIRNDLRILSIGLNPSLPSVREGFYFANPRNRFWRALQGSGLLADELEPGVAAMDVLLDRYGIGFTDVVKRPTAGGRDLRAADYRKWVPRLEEKLLRYQPAIAWFHGKVAYGHYSVHTGTGRRHTDWGAQPCRIGETRVFVTPNPSPANAAWSLDDLTAWYRHLLDYLSEVD